MLDTRDTLYFKSVVDTLGVYRFVTRTNLLIAWTLSIVHFESGHKSDTEEQAGLLRHSLMHKR